MRSNVRKMWTALLAVLFAAAVGFGLWFAFAPAARPANVHAAEETTVEIKKTENASTLYSNQPVEQLLGQFISGTVTLAGASTPSDLLSFAATGGVSYQVYAQYDAEQDQLSEERDDLRPDSDETAESYSRWVVAIAEVDGVPIESNPLELTVTKATISSLTAWFSGNNTFSALTAIPQDAPLTVQVMYSPGAGQPFSPDRGSEYGTYQIIYNQEGEYTDRLEYRDTSITIKYTEGNVSKSVQVAVNVSEAYVETPRWKDYNVVPELSYTGEERTVELEKYDSTSLTNDANVESEDGILSLTGTDADEYSVTISVKEGYKFREDFPQYATATYKDGKIVALKYTWKITQASIDRVTVAGNWKDGWTFGTPDAAPSKENVVLNILYEGSSETVTKLPDDVGATVTFYFSGTANDGTSYGPSSTLPTKAGNYSWTVSLTGMNNFEDFTGTDANGGSGSFVIEKKTLSVPALKNTKPDYTGEAQSATATYDSSLMSFDGDLDTESRIDVGVYHATFTLKDPDNYKWADGAAVSGEKDKVATVTWEIIQAENTISDFELAQSSWVWSETAAPSPSATAKFGGGITYKYYSDATLQNEITSPTTWNVGTYYVTATSSSDTSEHKNYTSVRTKAIPFTVSRAPIAQPELSQSEFTYDGTKKTPTLNVSSQYYTFTVEGKTDAGDDYKATVTLDDNHCWENVTGDAATAALELDWKILPAGIGVEGTLSIVGWTYGSTPNDPSGMSISESSKSFAASGGDTLTGEYRYYTYDSSAQLLLGVPTDAGTYYVRYHAYSDTENFTEAYSQFVSFTIAQKEVTVSWSNTEFTYNGTVHTPTAETSDFVLDDDVSLTVMGGQTDAGTSYTATASLAGTDKDNYVLKAGTATASFSIAKKMIGIEWGTLEFIYNGQPQQPTAEPTGVVDGDDLTLTVTVSGEHKNAGDYTATASLSGNGAGNYQLPADATKEFVIHKLEVRIQALGQTGRQLEHTGSPLSPSITLIGSDGVQLEGVATQQGFYDSAQSELGSEPSAYGSYYVLWKLNDSTNYAWGAINESDQISGFKDKINGESIYIAYQITGSSYQITISANNWTVGDTLQDLFSVAAADGYQDKYEAALNEGLTVTYTFLNAAGQQQIGKAIDFTVNAANQNFALTAASIPEGVALNAGTYTLRVEFSESANKNYASAWASATFTVSAYELQEGDVKWTEPSDLIYKGTEYTFGAKNTYDIYATYKTWSYANGKYTRATTDSYLTLSLPDGVQSILNAGGYTLSASLPENEHAVALPTDAEYAKNPITVSPKKINVTLEGYSETYKGEAFSGFFATRGHSYNGKTLFTIEKNGLCGSDTLEGKFTYPSQRDAGSYAWNSIAWSNTNYSVNVTNRTEKVFKIDPAPITVTIKNRSSTYGDDLATLTYEITEGKLQGKDTADTIFTLQAQKDDRTPLQKGDDASDYKIVGSTTGEGLINSGNYDVTFVDAEVSGKNYGTYTITQRNLTITVTGSIEYGEDAPTKVADYTVNFSDALESDKETLKGLLSITAGDYSAGNDKGNYDLTVSGNEDAASDQTWNNYSIIFAASTLTVTPREISVTIQDVTTTYGTMRELSATASREDGKTAIFGQDDPYELALYNATLSENLNAGEYIIYGTAKDENYSITFVGSQDYGDGTGNAGSYKVDPQSLTITYQFKHLEEPFDSGKELVYDGAAWEVVVYAADVDETITFKVTYQVMGENGEYTDLGSQEVPTNAGNYKFNVAAGQVSGNYQANNGLSASFIIKQREVSVTWTESTFTYDGTDQKDDVTAGYRAYHDGKQDDTLTNLKFTVQPEFKNAGTGYTFTAVLSDQNYKLVGASEDGSVSKMYQMNKAPITISVSSPTFTYGDFDGTYSAGEGTETGELTYQVGGLKTSSDTVQVTLSYSQGETTVTSPTNVGTYTVSATIAEHQNYTLDTVAPGTLTIDPRELTVNVVGTSIEYGEVAPNVYDVTLTGALSDEEDDIKELLTFDTSAYSAGDIVDDYTVKVSFGADGEGILKNYQYTVTEGAVATCTLKVTQRKITVEITNVTTDYGTAGTLTANVTREDGTTNDAILNQDLVKEGGLVVSGIAQFANVFRLSLDNATLDRLLNVGEYTIVGAVTTGGNARGDNYDITFKSEDGTGNAGLYTVDPLEVTVNFAVVPHEGSEDPVYDGKEWTFTATAEGVDGEDVTFQVTYTASAGSQLTGGFAIDAGTYTVSVKQGEKNIVADGEASNYIVEADQSKEFTIEKRTLTLEWVHTNVIPQEDGSGENKTKGYDSALMEFESYTQGTGMNEPTVEDGELKVTFTANGRTTYYVRVGLKDPLNYAWPENSANVSGENGKDIQISFSVNATTNNITFGLSGSAGSAGSVSEVSGTYGEEFKVYIAESEDESPAGYNVVVYIDSIVKGDADTDYYYRFARDEAGITADTANTLKYDLLVDDLTTAGAGTYWMQVFALTDENSEYGIGRAYVKVTIGKKTITRDEINAIGFTTSFIYNGKEQKPVAIDLPEYLKVTFSQGATDVTEGTKLTATFTIVGNNCEFAPGVTGETTVTIIITPYVIDAIYWDENPSFIYNGTDQSKDVLVYFVDVNDGRAKLTATTKTEGGFRNAGDYTFEAQVPNGNYEFAVRANKTSIITMARKQVNVVILDQSGEYSGKGFELQTRYNIDGLHSYDTALYKELAEKLELVIQDGAAINAGTYTITLAEGYKDLQNYEVTLQTGTLTITPKQLTFTWPTVTGGVYQGENPGVTLTGNEFEGFVDGEDYGNIESLIKIVYSGTTNAGTPYSGDTVPAEAGSYTVTVTLGEGNYTLNAGAQAYLVARADYSFTVDINGWTYNAYDATANAPSVSGEHPENLSVTYTYAEVLRSGVYGDFTNTVPTNAGSYVVRAQYAQGNNYNEAVAETLFTIEKAAITVKITFKQQVEGVSGWVNGWVFGTTPGEIYELDKSSNPGGGKETATYSTGSWSGSAIPTEVGEYTLTVTVAETANYKSGSAKVEFEIVQASEDELSFTVSIDDWTYGYKPNAPSVVKDGSPFLHPDQISPVYTYAKAKADGETYSDKDFLSTVPTNAGSYVVKATFAETDHYGELSAMCKFVIGKAAASIDTSGVKKSFTYNGRAQALSGAVLNHSETTLVYSPATVTAVGSYRVTISAAETANYSKVSVTVTVTVSRASAGFSVSIDDWTYGETPSRYVISGGSGGSVSVTYSGTTNAGVKYSSSKAPTEAGEYTITVVMGASGNFLGGTARDSFTIHRAKAEAELSLAGWMYGEEPNAYVLTPEFLRGEVVRVIYTDGTYYSEAVPKEVGSYTVTVIYAETDNYLGGEVSCKFSIVPYGLGLTVTLEGWTYGDKANEPIVTGAGGIGLMYAYTGTANDGTAWNSNTAPEKAGSYTLTVTVIEAGNYTGESASTDFVIARRLLSAPAWDEEGMRELIEVCSGDRMTRAILGFDMSLMNAQSATAQFMFDGTGAASVTANIHGVYTIVVSLKDAANYGWADLNEGETLTGPVTLTWTLTERVISLLWLIILLAVLIVIALIVLIVLLKKGRKPDGTDTGKGDVRLSSVAPVGLLLFVAPLGEIIAAVALGVVLAAVVIADIAVGVRNAKRAKAAENAQEPVLSYGDEAAAEGEAYFGTEVPADDGTEVASDEDGMSE